MQADRHSSTAVVMALVRAYHTMDPKPHVFEDRVARALVTDAECEAFEQTQLQQVRSADPAFAASSDDRGALVRRALQLGGGVGPLARARYVEERLDVALADGVRQYVLVGAGLETLAFRRPDLAERVVLIEIDHPATSALKRERIERAGLRVPANLHFAAADLARESLEAALAKVPYDPNVPAFFAWPGVTMYLPREAVLRTLQSMARVAAPKSAVVFDYFDPSAFAPEAPPRVRFVVQRAMQLGEPMSPNLDPATLASDLETVGLRLVEDLGPPEVQQRLLAHVTGFRAVECTHLVECRT